MKKKIIGLVILITFTLLVVACGNSAESAKVAELEKKIAELENTNNGVGEDTTDAQQDMDKTVDGAKGYEDVDLDNIKVASSTTQHELLKGKVLVPYTPYKSQAEVKIMFKQAGLTPEFIETEFDEQLAKIYGGIKKGECIAVSSSQPAIKYYTSDEVGDEMGDYADIGSTLLVRYADKDYEKEEE